MLKLLLVVAVVAVVIYLVLRAAERRSGGGGGGGVPRLPQRPNPPHRPMGPDDDPEFLRDLNRRNWQKKHRPRRDDPS